MKKLITLLSLIVFFAITVNAQCCDNAAQNPSCCDSNSQLASNTETPTVEAYYFHYTRRCVTCQSVEKVSADALKELYGSKVVLKSINLDEKGTEALAKKLGIEGQTLLIVKGAKKVELTNEGFMYATTNPGKLKDKLKSAVESLK